MGYNSTIIVMNDALHRIKDDADFGKKVHDAILKLNVSRRPVDISSGGYINAAVAVETHHADCVAVVAVGQNFASVLHTTYGSHYTDHDKVDILKRVAENMGYAVRKKPKLNAK